MIQEDLHEMPSSTLTYPNPNTLNSLHTFFSNPHTSTLSHSQLFTLQSKQSISASLLLGVALLMQTNVWVPPPFASRVTCG